MFIQTKVFDPELFGKAVVVEGATRLGGIDYNVGGVYIISEVDGARIRLLGVVEKHHLHMSDFENKRVKMHILGVEKPETQQQREPKRFISRRVREQEERQLDNEYLEYILRHNKKPMELNEIIERMRRKGRNHWNNKNGSGFMKMAIKDGYRIVRIGHGIYSYNGGQNG
ncbi:hypothetical protein NYE67_20635 [Solibacillus sp. FSL W8-0474]|uniref:hypothetical protein n=1 Tax=Solibacillus sp. FSL W8-0474 TaxID=2975336 RepID=UPI0030F85152